MIRDQKNEIRELYRAKRQEMPREEKILRDEAICAAAEGLISFRFAEYVLLYAAMPDEIDVSRIAVTALEKGKKILFPRTDRKAHTMEYHIVESPDQLEPGNWGLLEPPAGLPVYDAEKSPGGAVCFVPGLVYDRAGYRLGYGKGFYARYLSRFSGCTIGVIYSDFILDEVPRGGYDVSVDILLTEKGMRTTQARNRTHPGKG
jgi:5-formyltetrahydrofolate cyclo-ligase